MAEISTLEIEDAVVATLHPRPTHEDLVRNGVALSIIARRTAVGSHETFVGVGGSIVSGHLIEVHQRGAQ